METTLETTLETTEENLWHVKPQFQFLWQDPHKYKVVVACRGGGKTVAALQYAIYRLLTGPKNGTVLFFSSTLSQANTESDLERMQSKLSPRCFKYNKSRGEYLFFKGKNDVRRLRLMAYIMKYTRGSHPELIILDEFGEAPEGTFGTVIFPMLKDKSDLIVIGTPQGKNKFYDLWMQGTYTEYPDWGSYILKASTSNLLPQELLKRARQTLTHAEYAQEYECDFEANVLVGSVYGEFIDRYTLANTDDSFCWDPNLPVYTCWDVGFTDYVAIWFFQVKNGQITFIDFFQYEGEETSFYARELKSKSYTYATCILPWDGGLDKMNGKSISS
jgi:hypothetical protein